LQLTTASGVSSEILAPLFARPRPLTSPWTAALWPSAIPSRRSTEFSFAFLSARVMLYLFDQYRGVLPMEWTTPQHEEIDLNCEISSYANAEI
jgi:hypothetical protein